MDTRQPLELRDLRLSHQMFLWTVRHIVCAGEDRKPLCPLVTHFFDDAGLPRAIGAITALLRTLSAGARMPLTVNVPCGVSVLIDEQRLIDGLYDAGDGRIDKICADLGCVVKPRACHAVAQRLCDVAAQLNALESLRGASPRQVGATLH
ncbi:MAG: hypothetical protein AB8G17_21230 [Gammaproteobacteria bacterium]